MLRPEWRTCPNPPSLLRVSILRGSSQGSPKWAPGNGGSSAKFLGIFFRTRPMNEANGGPVPAIVLTLLFFWPRLQRSAPLGLEGRWCSGWVAPAFWRDCPDLGSSGLRSETARANTLTFLSHFHPCPIHFIPRAVLQCQKTPNRHLNTPINRKQ